MATLLGFTPALIGWLFGASAFVAAGWRAWDAAGRPTVGTEQHTGDGRDVRVTYNAAAR